MLKAAGLRRPGAAALDLAYVAAGRVDGFWEIGLKPWDTAAGTLLITEAGGRVGTLFGEDYKQGGHVDRAARQGVRRAGGGACAARTSELARSLTSGRRRPLRAPGCASGSPSKAVDEVQRHGRDA